MENRTHRVDLNSEVVFRYDDRKVNHVSFTLNFVAASDEPYPARSAGFRSGFGTVIDDYTDAVSAYYEREINAVSEFREVLQGVQTSAEFLINAARQSVFQNGLLDILLEIRAILPSRTTSETSDRVLGLFETAEDNGAPISFYQQASELRVIGSPTEQVQGNLFALTGLAYYFQKASDDGVSFAELAEFRDRAQALKADVGDVAASNAIDCLLQEMGQNVAHIQLNTLDGTHHSLVASYRLYGDISRARELIDRSGGVSGAELSPVVYV